METLQPVPPRAARRRFNLLSLPCDLCGERIIGSGYYFAEAGEGLDPPSVWTLCAICSALVTQQLERIHEGAPMRLRIAVGVAASERGVTRNGVTEMRKDDDTGFNRLLVAVVLLVFIVHAAAFILVVAVIAASH